ncbi:hypothetical protein [Chloroflexus sp.]|uniref:hypothetical protein n=1 Tax=Chloroflexus sp. TaxID=1904827 RepID=UPI00404A1A5F
MKTEQTQMLMATKVIKAGVCHMLTSFRYMFRSIERADIGCIIASSEDLAQKSNCREESLYLDHYGDHHRGDQSLLVSRNLIAAGVISTP